MTSEEPFRWLFVSTFLAAFSISGYYRYKARRDGERIPRALEGGRWVLLRLLFAVPLYGSVLAYMLNPGWMSWSAVSLPSWLRWVAAGVGLAMLPLLAWVLRSLGSNISETFLTKERHALVTHGPYRWVRHPLYSVASMAFLSLGILAASWFIVAMALLVVIGMSLVVIPQEEARLVQKFGHEYRDYMKRTGRLLPRLRSFEHLAAP